MIDLSLLNRVTVDPSAKRARAQGGALISDLDAATQAHGLAVPMGVVGHTGVGGLTLGGGMGWLTRQAGLSVDKLVSAEVVVADGRVLRAAEDENADLFWALRGGGGNFGVVTEFEFRLHEVGPTVQFGLFFWEQDRGREALRLMREVIADLPRSLNAIPATALTAPPAPFVPAEHHNKLGCALLLVGFGDPDEHQQAVDRIRTALPPLFDLVTPMPYVALQQLLDEANAWGSFGYDKGAYIENLTDEVIEILSDYAPRKSSPLSVLLFYRLDGAYSEVGEEDTAFGGGRSPRYMGFFIGLCPTPDLLPAEREWIRSLWDALRPHMMGAGTYVNALEGQDESRIRDTYGPKYSRLAAVKAKYDPGNVFHRNVNIASPVS
jgi:FAD/FMN-containing dehydrogenase